MKIIIIPLTKYGKLTVGLIISFFVFLGMFYFLVWSGQRGGEYFFSNLTLTVPILIAGASAVSAVFTGLIAIVKEKERSFLVYGSILIGIFVLLFILGEILYPH